MNSKGSSTTESNASAWQVLKQFVSLLPKRRQAQLVMLAGLMLVGALAELVTIGSVVPFVGLLARPEMAAEFPILQSIFDFVGWQGPNDLVLPMTVLFIGVVLVSTVFRLMLAYVSNKVVFAIGHDLGVQVYDRILNQPYIYHISQNSSEVIGGVNKVDVLLNGLLRPIIQGLIAVIVATGILGALLWVDAITALVAGLVFVMLYWIIIQVSRLRLRKNSAIIAEAQNKRIQTIQEGLGGIRDVILDANQPHYVKTFSVTDWGFRQAQAANAFLSLAPRYVVEMIGIALIVGLAFKLTTQPGGLVAALPVLGALALGAARLLPLIQQIYQAWASFSGSFRVMEDVLGLLSLPSQKLTDVSKADVSFDEAIELKGIGFHYGSETTQVIENLSVRISKGSRVGIVGKTGSGKSTLMDIVMGLLFPTEGAIWVDGKKVDRENLGAWQSHIAHVPQHIYLSDASIAENIALGQPADEIDMMRVREAARQAQIADFIETYRQGYETRVGEWGIQLSGGQRQRVGIARALYKAADVLVFDEASSALDMDTERAVMDAVNQLDANLTVFIIAHRVQTLKACDLVLRLDKGQLAATGAYRDVIESGVRS